MTSPADASSLAALARDSFSLATDVTFLNHGSYGACPTPVLARQAELRARMERQPVDFFQRALEPLLDESRAALADFLGAPASDLAFVPNATAGVNAVVRSLDLQPGDEVVTTDHEYNACKNALAYAAERARAELKIAKLPLPVAGPEQIVAAVLSAVTARTKLVLIDHVTSPTALVLPVARLVRELAERGIDTLVDGAHAPGMIELNIESLGAAYYTGNCHKWLCAPKGAGFLYVRPDRQARVRPTSVSHGANSPRRDRSRFLIEFDWTGTTDFTPYICVADAIRFGAGLLPGGWPALRARNHALACHARRRLLAALEAPEPCPESMLGTMASVPIDGPWTTDGVQQGIDPLNEKLRAEYGVEIPVFPWPTVGRRMIRLSAAAYNQPSDYDKLIAALAALGARRAQS
jgi:isopenicillin-N epimerase